MMSRINLLLGGLLVIVVAFSAWVRIDFTVPNIEILPDMKYTAAWLSYSPNPLFKDGKTLQVPVLSTIARGEHPLHFTPSKEDALRAGEELQNPWKSPAPKPPISSEIPAKKQSDQPAKPLEEPKPGSNQVPPDLSPSPMEQSIARGGRLFRIYCVACHGGSGLGDGLVAQRGFPPPPSLMTGKSLQMKDGQVFHILTYGQGVMAPFAGQISQEQRWDLVSFIRDLQKKNASATPGATP